MREISVSLDKFDLDGFIGKVLNFLKTQVYEGIDPSCAICWVEERGCRPHDEDESGWDFRSKLLYDRVILFFPFAYPDYRGSFDCADGGCYKVPVEDEDEYDYQWPIEEDVVGYLVRVNDGAISIASAICPLCIPSPTIDQLLDCKELEQPMIEFIHGFIK